MTREQFIRKVQGEVTEGGSIPFKVKRNRIDSIIDQAIEHFKVEYDRASQFEYLVIKSSAFSTQMFRDKRRIQLDKCVVAVGRAMIPGSMGLDNLFVSHQPDYMKTNYGVHIALSGGNKEGVVQAVTTGYFQQYLQSLIRTDVEVDYNPATAQLTVIGGDTTRGLVLEAYVQIPESKLFEDYTFFRYVCGKTRMSLYNILSFADKKLIGGSSINVSILKDSASDDFKYVDNIIENDRKDPDIYIL